MSIRSPSNYMYLSLQQTAMIAMETVPIKIVRKSTLKSPQLVGGGKMIPLPTVLCSLVTKLTNAMAFSPSLMQTVILRTILVLTMVAASPGSLITA